MSNSSFPDAPVLPLNARLLAHPLSRIVIASLAVTLPIALTLILVQQTLDKSMRQVWPQLLCSVLCVVTYVLYVRKIEKREVSELSRNGAGRELGLGVLIGSAAFLVVISTLMSSGVYQVDGSNPWTTMLSPLTELALVAFFEEILFRGIILRNIETWLGRLPSLLLSAGLFALAHLPNAGISLTSIAVTIAAGLMFGAAYFVTWRLWLPIGIHFSWNFISDAVFSLPTSGLTAKGLLQGQLSGPEWLSGGTYGIEASLVTLVAISVARLDYREAALRGYLHDQLRY
jgi:membrane protease YdiL (CAAX protease family)